MQIFNCKIYPFKLIFLDMLKYEFQIVIISLNSFYSISIHSPRMNKNQRIGVKHFNEVSELK